MQFEIRQELPEDVAAIREVNRLAFGQDQEANLVDALRDNGASLLSLVATLDSQIVGHIMYSPITVGDETGSSVTGSSVSGSSVSGSSVVGAALAPMSVLPEHQQHGIGSKLIEAGTRHLRASGYPFIIVLGHPTYYPRFGFQPAANFGITCEWPVPSEAFMVLVLDEKKMRGISGLAQYRHEFSTVS